MLNLVQCLLFGCSDPNFVVGHRRFLSVKVGHRQKHRVHPCSKASILVYTVLRSFKTVKPNTYIQIFKTYIRPLIEYNQIIWSPNLKSEIRLLESVQRKYTRIMCQKLNIPYSNYQQRLQMFNLESLESRRLKSDLIAVYKLLNNLIDLNPDDFLIRNNINQKYNLRRHNQYLQYPKLSCTSIRRTFFSVRVIKIWNCLPTEIVTSKCLSIFKQSLKSLDLSLFTELIF